MLAWLNTIQQLLQDYRKEIVVGSVSVLLTYMLMKVFPWVGKQFTVALEWASRSMGGRLRERAFLRAYLRWVESHSLEMASIRDPGAVRMTIEDVYVPPRLNTQGSSGLQSSPTTRPTSPKQADRVHRAQLLAYRTLKKVVFESFGHFRIAQDGPVFGDFCEDQLSAFNRVVNWFASRQRRDLPPGECLSSTLAQLGMHVAILGEGGAGKSSLLQWLAVIHARARVGKWVSHRKYRRLTIGRKPAIPIPVSLSALADQLSTGTSLLGCMKDFLPPDLKEWCPDDFFLKLVQSGRGLILLDGLDEVFSDHDYLEIKNLIHGFVSLFPNNRMIVTCRPSGWRSGLGPMFTCAEIQPLSVVEVRQLVTGWYKQRYYREPGIIASLTESLMTQINRDSRLLRLASSPLMVTIMVTVQRSPGGCVPLDRASLYRRCVETLLEWDASKGISAASTGLRTSQKAAILRRLAWALQSGEFGGAGTSTDREAVTELFESIMRNLGLPVELAPSVTEHLVGRTGLLVESAGRGLAFTHLSFQEYFVAEYLASHCGAEKFLEDPDQATGAWRDIFLLAVGMLPDATPLLGVAYRPDTADLFRDYLRLSANVITDATEIRDTLLVNKVLQECLEVASYGQFQMPEIVPGELRQYLLHHVGGFIGRYLSLRRYASGGPSFRTSILEQIRSWSLVDQIAGLDALKSCDLSASEIESILDFLAISDLTPSVAHILRKYANTHEPSPSMIRAVVQRAIATLGESNRSAQFQELFPLLARWRPVDPGLLVALRTAVSESIVFFIHAAFLLGMLSEDGVAVFEQMKSDRNIGTDLSGIERICMVAGALSAGLIPGCELVELARRYREDPRLLSRGKQYGLHLLTFGDPAVAVPCISDYINHSAYGYAAIGALFTLGGPALRETEKDALLALIRLNCCGNRSRKVVPRGRFIMAAGLLSQSHLLSSDELLELCEMAHPYVVKALTENLLITAHWAILAQMGDIYRRRVEQGTLPEDVEWCFIQRLAKAEWWTDPSGAAISILERYLTDKRWYFRSITLGAWTCTDSRPPMSPSVIKKVYASLSDSTGYGAPKGISADSPQVSAFYALAAEAILLGAWPTTGGSGRQIAGVVH